MNRIPPLRSLILCAALILPRLAGGAELTAWGDSLTGGTATAWPAQLALLTGLRMNARGVGGQTSTQIKDRFLAESARWGDITIVWAGRNNFGDPVTVKADVATMVSHLTTTNYVVLGVTNGSSSSEWSGTPGYATMTGLNSDLASTYGSRFIDIRRILVDSYNPSLPQDVIDFGHDTLPASLRGDAIHINEAGHIIVANAINNAIASYIPYSPDTKWSAGITGIWNTPANWTNGLPAGTPVNSSLVPVAGNARIPASASAYTVTLNSPATTNDLTVTSLIGSQATATTLNINSALSTTGINQTGTPAGRLVTGGNPVINVNSGGSVNLAAQAYLGGGTLNVNAGGSFVWGNICTNQTFFIIGSTVNIFGSLAGTTGSVKGNQGMIIEYGGSSSLMSINGGSASVDTVNLLYNCGSATLNILNNGSLTIRNNTNTYGITMGDVWNGSASAFNNDSTLNLVSGTVTNGAVGMLRISYLAAASNAKNTAALNILGGTFRQYATTYIGSGRNGSLNVSGGSFISAGDIFAGGTADKISSAPSGVTASGTISVSGGSLTAANIRIGDGSFTGFGGANAAWNSPGILNLSGGSVTASSLSATSTNGTISFSGGTLNTAGTAIANGSVFQVGNGTLAAALNLNGGTHSFASGLAISSNGTLSGSGSVVGDTSASGTLLARFNSSGVPSADLVNVNGSVSLLPGSVLQLSDRAGIPVQIPVHTTLTVLRCSGTLTGTFSGLGEGAFITAGPNLLVIHYTPTAVTLESTAPSYASWASANGIAGEAGTADHDLDGLSNALEYALGLNPAQPNASPGSFSGNAVTFNKGAEAISNGDVTFVIEQSEDLVAWLPVVTQSPPNVSTTISYILPAGKPKIFVRLSVSVQ